MSSNKACCWILAIIAGGFALSAILIGWGISRAVGDFSAEFSSSSKLKEHTWLLLDPSGTVSDYHVEPDLAFWDNERGSSLNEMQRALRSAAKDERIAGVILRPQGAAGFATIQELRAELGEFKKSGKPVYAHLDVATDRDYYLASLADSIFVMPGRLGGITFGGLAYSSTYLKGTFEKLGIKFHVLHVGRYKGAYEDLARDSMSTELRESILALYQDVYASYVRETAEARTKLTFAALNKEFMEGDQLIVNGPTCLTRGYADALEDWRTLRERLKGDNEKFEAVSPHAYLKSRPRDELTETTGEVAVLYAQGEISFDSGDDMSGDGITASGLTAQLDKLAEDDDVKSIVLRVNSPGGSALASKQILETIKRVKGKKPIVVSMGRVAASGGYYISAEANEIVAEPNTLTGSIGVVSVFPSAEELYAKIGAREETISIGKWANFFRIDQDLGPEQDRVLRDLMDSVYVEFREDVMNGRGLSLAAFDTVAEGRIWTGRQALERGLVDTLGGLDLAVKIAAQRANLEDDKYDVAYYPKKRDIFEYVAMRIGAEVRNLLTVAGSLPVAEDPQKVVEYVKKYFDRMEFIQARMPVIVTL